VRAHTHNKRHPCGDVNIQREREFARENEQHTIYRSIHAHIYTDYL